MRMRHSPLAGAVRPAIARSPDSRTRETSGAAERSPRWPARADPDRRPGLLDRRGEEQALGNAVVTALVGKRLATPQAADDVESLIDQFVASARVWILAEGGELLPAL